MRPPALAAERPVGPRPALRGLRARLGALLPRDARLYQIAFLALLLGTGVLARDFSLAPAQVALTFAAGIATQLVWVRALGLQGVGVLSAVITCFGLSVLLRADSLWVHPLAAAACLSAKFVLRVDGKHLFNPTNLGIVLAVLLLPGAWVSPGQWGSDLLVACWVVALGGIVASRARSVDLSLLFLAFFLGAYALRVAWLGQSGAVFAHLLQNGTLLMFAFFMISDPMTAPNRAAARVLYAACVAGAAFGIQYALFIPNGPIWALALCAPLVPLLDRIWPGARPAWRPQAAGSRPPASGAAR
ncbi:MAG: RnfABCDGE type electron transport complex subunit D [Burkholderiales bacterium]|nr:RnfABCDGE type electron transport complex subunit D [Burkholderiales bacterium]